MTQGTIRKTLGNVHVATDFTDGALAAGERAARLPLTPGAAIELVHVLPEDSGGEAAERVGSAAKARLEGVKQEVVRDLRALGNEDHSVFVSIKHGKPFVEIARNAHHGRAELLVIGRHGSRSFRDLFIGSTAERIIRKGDTSVLVVSHKPDGDYKRPLLAADMSDSSRLALELALCLAEPGLASLDVVSVVPPPGQPYLGEAALVLDLAQQSLDEREQRVRAQLTEFVAKSGVNTPCNLIVRTGDPRQTILEVAKERGSDLIALGTEGKSGITHALVGSVAEGVLRNASCDVLVARAPRPDFNL
ncbi:MAG: universal stress protein [Myxococcota bacterium]